MNTTSSYFITVSLYYVKQDNLLFVLCCCRYRHISYYHAQPCSPVQNLFNDIHAVWVALQGEEQGRSSYGKDYLKMIILHFWCVFWKSLGLRDDHTLTGTCKPLKGHNFNIVQWPVQSSRRPFVFPSQVINNFAFNYIWLLLHATIMLQWPKQWENKQLFDTHNTAWMSGFEDYSESFFPDKLLTFKFNQNQIRS